MKIALAQINTTVADFEGNSQKIIAFSKKAKGQGADLVVFPELALSGYPPRDLAEVPSFIEWSEDSLRELVRLLPPDIGVLLGYLRSNKTPDQRGAFNSVVLIENGRILFTYDKCLLPNYDVFDEARTFQPGSVDSLATFRGKKLGISICEDIWNDKLFWKKRLYSFDPIEAQVKLGADVLINLSASPFFMGKDQTRTKMLQNVCQKYKRPLVFVNLVGGNDELLFDGCSFGLDKQGRFLASAKFCEEDLIVVDISKEGQNLAAQEMSDMEQMEGALVLGVRDYAAKCGFKKALLGVSGGIDSALVAALAAKALGAGNVLGLILPSEFTSSESMEDAQALCRHLKIKSEIISIQPIYDVYKNSLKKKQSAPVDVELENIQARIRGNLLMAHSNRDGSLLLTTGNKSELAVGYCTLYGDMSGGLAVISDLSKTQVFELARHLNRNGELIPKRILTKAPSAELRPNQKDQDSLPPYELLDQILKLYIEEQKGVREIVALGFEEKLVEEITRKVRLNEYKRRQAAPGIKVTQKAFGMGRRFPIARKI